MAKEIAPGLVAGGVQPKPPAGSARAWAAGNGLTTFLLVMMLGLGVLLGLALASGFMYVSGQWTPGIEVIVDIIEVAAVISLTLLLFYFVYNHELTEFKCLKNQFAELEETFEKIGELYTNEKRAVENEVVILKEEGKVLHGDITELKEAIGELKNLLVDQSLKGERKQSIADEKTPGCKVKPISAEKKEFRGEIGERREGRPSSTRASGPK